ncbi:MAG: DNA adenine methylase [Firmicutes bacterium]|nr:DNA adenine methylase [Bacillota bacterium]
MRYSGSKYRFIKELIPILEKEIKPNQYFVEPFIGGANIISNINHHLKIGSDLNENLIEMWKYFQLGGTPPKDVTKELYYDIKNNQSSYPKWIIGYVANACSYGGKYWGGYANFNPNKNNGKGEDHIKEAYNGTVKQLENFKFMEVTKFFHSSYEDLEYPPNSVIYLDPPYENTTKQYKNSKFNSYNFWGWCKKMKNNGHTLFISEYNAPSDFICVWEKTKKCGMATTKTDMKQNVKVEKLFTI